LCHSLTSIVFAPRCRLTRIEESAFFDSPPQQSVIPSPVMILRQSGFVVAFCLSVTRGPEFDLHQIKERTVVSPVLCEMTIPSNVAAICRVSLLNLISESLWSIVHASCMGERDIYLSFTVVNWRFRSTRR
jgi:hypothetical protein